MVVLTEKLWAKREQAIISSDKLKFQKFKNSLDFFLR